MFILFNTIHMECAEFMTTSKSKSKSKSLSVLLTKNMALEENLDIYRVSIGQVILRRRLRVFDIDFDPDNMGDSHQQS